MNEGVVDGNGNIVRNFINNTWSCNTAVIHGLVPSSSTINVCD